MRKNKHTVYTPPSLDADALAVGITNYSAVLVEALRSKVADALGKTVKAFTVTCKHCGASFSNLAWLKCSDEKKGKCLVCGEPIKIVRRKK
ncbi:MAG: hypothetical protein WCX64_04800 [Candidatus Micrarchaeia archaeon]|jgi:rRNA maturation endonuclease Nob1